MEKTAIVTDTNSGISIRQAEEMGIHLILMPFFIDGVTYLEERDISARDFFDRMREGAEVSTSQPAPEVITSLWEELLETHDSILHFPMTSGLSGSCQTAKALAAEYGGRVVVVDDHRISVTLMQSICNAQVLLSAGRTAAEVRDILEAEKDASSIYIAVNTLEYLKRSGRVTAAGAAMAAVLHIKPVLQIQGGLLDAYKKVRGMAKAKLALLDALHSDLSHRFAGERMRIFSGYSGGDPELGLAWQKVVQAEFPDYQVDLISLPLSICCHTGEGALGVACAKEWA